MADISVDVEGGLSDARFTVEGSSGHRFHLRLIITDRDGNVDEIAWNDESGSTQTLTGGSRTYFLTRDFGITPISGTTYRMRVSDTEDWKFDEDSYTRGSGNINISLNSRTTTTLNVTAAIDGYNRIVDSETLWLSLYLRNGEKQKNTGGSSSNGSVTIDFSDLTTNTMYWAKSAYGENTYAWVAIGTAAKSQYSCRFNANTSSMERDSCSVIESYYDALVDARNQTTGSRDDHPNIVDAGNMRVQHWPTSNFQDFHADADLDFSATPNQHYTINWRNGTSASGDLITTSNTYTISSLNSTFSIYAHAVENAKNRWRFYTDSHTTISGDLTIGFSSRDPNNSIEFYIDEDLPTITANADEDNGYHFEGWYWINDDDSEAPSPDTSISNPFDYNGSGTWIAKSTLSNTIKLELFLQGNTTTAHGCTGGHVYASSTATQYVEFTEDMRVGGFSPTTRQATRIEFEIDRNTPYICIEAYRSDGDADIYINNSLWSSGQPLPTSSINGAVTTYKDNELNMEYNGATQRIYYIMELIKDTRFSIFTTQYNTYWAGVGIKTRGIESANVEQKIVVGGHTYTRKATATARSEDSGAGFLARENINVSYTAFIDDNINDNSWDEWLTKNSSLNWISVTNGTNNPWSSPMTQNLTLWACATAPDIPSITATLKIKTPGLQAAIGKSKDILSPFAYYGHDVNSTIDSGETFYINILPMQNGGYKRFNLHCVDFGDKTYITVDELFYITTVVSIDTETVIELSGCSDNLPEEFQWDIHACNKNNYNDALSRYTTGKEGWKWDQDIASTVDGYHDYYGFYVTHGEWQRLRGAILDWEQLIQNIEGKSDFSCDLQNWTGGSGTEFTSEEYRNVLNAIQKELDILNLESIKTTSGGSVKMEDDFPGIQKGQPIQEYYLNALMAGINRVRDDFKESNYKITI